MSLSDRIRPNSEAAPWVIDEVKKMEADLVMLADRVAELESTLERKDAKVRKLGAEVDGLNELADHYRNKCRDLERQLAKLVPGPVTVN